MMFVHLRLFLFLRTSVEGQIEPDFRSGLKWSPHGSRWTLVAYLLLARASPPLIRP